MFGLGLCCIPKYFLLMPPPRPSLVIDDISNVSKFITCWNYSSIKPLCDSIAGLLVHEPERFFL